MANTGFKGAPGQVPLPLTYADLVLDNDLDPFAAETTSDLQNLIQDVGHILVETLGSNPDDINRGVGIYNYLSGTVKDFQGVVGIIEKQLTTDDRIDSCNASIVQNSDDTFTLYINIAVDGSVIPLQYGWSLTNGLTNATGG